MAKILGLDLGTNSVGWAIIDDSSNQIIDCEAKIFPTSFNNERQLARQQRRTDNRFMQRALTFYRESKLSRRTNPVILTLVCFSVLTALLTVINLSNWQFWLNLSLTVFVATLSLIHQRKDK
jgi:CRISPR/Cas system Type II protein with McrA/HNH and RuvC-like nuclease domain